ncbi:S8 family serine peptidase [Planctomycetes bacterium K23_9]|uniref:Serine protease AprX n=1 Tax=Stieleria marina TaxID=1930275 RepID=A0A517NUI8_9BACT|nr:Serine protease AprX [Planctomycetes bacterium K23_9]
MSKYVVSIRNEEDRQATTDAANQVIADYGHSILVDLDASAIGSLESQNIRFRELPEDPTVKVNGYRLNTSMQAARVQASPRTLEVAGPVARGPYIVRFIGPMYGKWIADLEGSLNAKILSSLGNNSYLIAVGSDKLDALSGKPFVASVSDYLPQFKIARQLLTPALEAELSGHPAITLESDLGDHAESVAPQIPPEGIGTSFRRRVTPEPIGNLRVTLFDHESRESVVRALQELDNVSVVESEDDTIILSARSEALSSIAEILDVRDIEPNQIRELHNNIASTITQAEVLANSLNLRGSNQVVGVADTGIDTGDVVTMSQDFRGRIAANRIHARGRLNNANDPDGHGTHVAGSILGGGANSNGMVRGMAPEAELVFQSVLDAQGGLGGLPLNLNNLFLQAFNDGARIHNNSWGVRNSNGAYSSNSHEVDEFAFSHRDFLIVFSAGNDGPSRVTSPGTAKNALTVGASESVRPLPSVVSFPTSARFPTPPSINGLDGEANSDRDIASFSSPGPAENNRRKPDVVAPGTWILSARSSVAVADTGPDGLAGLPRTPAFPNGGTGDEDGVPTHAESVGLGLPGQPIMFAGNANAPPLPLGAGNGAAQHYMYQNGTSMAAPVTTGCCALVREYLQSVRSHVPSAALVKATIVNGSANIRASVPDNAQGWGRVTLADSVTPAGHQVQFDDDITHSVSSFQIREFDATVHDLNQPVTVTLVWRDPAGRTIQNLLHLRVFDSGSSTALVSDAIADIRNNVQKVIVPSPSGTTIRVEVEGINVGIGVTERLPQIEQDFALVVGNATALVMI